MVARNWLPSPSPFEAAAHQPGDVHESDAGRNDLLRLAELGEALPAADPATAISPTFGSMVQNG